MTEYLGASPDVESTLKEFQAARAFVCFTIKTRMYAEAVGLSRKYRYMEHNLTQRRGGLEDKIPDIKKTLSMIEFLQERRVSLLRDAPAPAPTGVLMSLSCYS